ncbi:MULTISPECIES: response regulator [Pseudoalteromonas]|uniref:Response regulator transcription factor n=1 Tax=Pseudoalteromonas obscura TaxID=3048491 RepID=A0ABT7EL40_9GAMM|nr:MULTISPECIES: response regulator transcription factor [Pseudoalteromonas]MBQ4837664.1 response regulator transcription factor [Pseudoalteromonas luteoviolacea]MDK2595755.1 response regulator transcription factor [Pseudoalteromonas sp. P94(2023)]
MISCLLVEDQTLVRLGLESLLNLSECIRVTGVAQNGIEALERIKEAQFDVMLLDMRMPELDGLGVLSAMQKLPQPTPPVLIITTFEDCDTLVNAVNLGAKGYVLKSIELEDLIEAIKQVVAGQQVLQKALTDYLLKKQLVPQMMLTTKELQVLKCLTLGMPNKEIAITLNNSDGTIRNHVSQILAKLDVNDRTQAVLKAFDKGLV